MTREFTQQVGNFQCHPQFEGIQTCIAALMDKPPPFQDGRICVPGTWASMAVWLSTSCGNTLRPTPQIFAAVYISEMQREPNHSVLSFVTLFCFLSYLVLTSFLYSVIVFKEESCSRAMLIANCWSTGGGTGWGAGTLNRRDAIGLGLPLHGQLLQPLSCLHRRCQKNILKELIKLGSVSRQKCPHLGESLMLWILRLRKCSPTCMLEVLPEWGLYLPLQPPFCSWYPPHVATAHLMNRTIYYKTSTFPASVGLVEKNCGANSCVYSMCWWVNTWKRWYWTALWSQKSPHDSRSSTLNAWEGLQSHFPARSQAAYSRLFHLPTSTCLWWLVLN